MAAGNQLTKGRGDERALFQNQHHEISHKIERSAEPFIDEEINDDLYSKYYEKYLLEKRKKFIKSFKTGVEP
jgi:hypothetical protein